jgi:hypothetical protein
MTAAERQLWIAGPQGDISVPIRIEVPVDDRTAWICRFNIGWPDGPASGRVAALDAVQALLFAFEHIAMLLYMSKHHAAGTLRFDAPGEGYGFPLPAGSRDLAIGLDKTL